MKSLSTFAALLVLFFTAHVFAFQDYEDTLMYMCQNAALAMGGYDEYYVDIYVRNDANEEVANSFYNYMSKSLRVKEVKKLPSATRYTVMEAAGEDRYIVSFKIQSFLNLRKGITGNCHLEL